MERYNEMMKDLELERSKEIKKLMEFELEFNKLKAEKRKENAKKSGCPVRCRRAILF